VRFEGESWVIFGYDSAHSFNRVDVLAHSSNVPIADVCRCLRKRRTSRNDRLNASSGVQRRDTITVAICNVDHPTYPSTPPPEGRLKSPRCPTRSILNWLEEHHDQNQRERSREGSCSAEHRGNVRRRALGHEVAISRDNHKEPRSGPKRDL
jgi:hypothetical protein